MHAERWRANDLPRAADVPAGAQKEAEHPEADHYRGSGLPPTTDRGAVLLPTASWVVWKLLMGTPSAGAPARFAGAAHLSSRALYEHPEAHPPLENGLPSTTDRGAGFILSARVDQPSLMCPCAFCIPFSTLKLILIGGAALFPRVICRLQNPMTQGDHTRMLMLDTSHTAGLCS